MYNYVGFKVRYDKALQKYENSEKRNFILKRACRALVRFDEYIRYEIISEWSGKFKISEKLLNSYMFGKTNYELTEIEKMQEFLSSFNIRQNEISKEVIISKGTNYYTLDELHIMAGEYGLKRIKLIDKLLNINNKNITVVKKFNPLADYFRALAKDYNGEPVIHELAKLIPAYNFGQKDKTEYYQNRLETYFHKWLCKAAGQALGVGANDVMLLWIEPFGGSGKSYINRWLFSDIELQKYYIRIGENESFLDMKGISANKFSIDWDELPLSKKRYNTFKSYIAAEGGQQYNSKTKQYENYTRQVNFLGSTNKANRENQKGYLLEEDAAMMRRILPIELDGRINYKEYLKLDLKQLWGQAAAEILQAQKTGNKNLLTWEDDWTSLRAENAKYINTQTKDVYMSVLNKFKPAEYGKGVLLSSRDIITQLERAGMKINLSPESLGKYLSRRNYKKGRTVLYRGWWVYIN